MNGLDAAANERWRSGLAFPAFRRDAGPEWTGHRDYSPGDDLRAVDWACCARFDELYTRRVGGEIDGRSYFLLDCSRSMSLGSPSKFVVASRIVAALADVAIGRLDEVRLSAFADGLVGDSQAVRGRMAAARLSGFWKSLRPQHGLTDFARFAAGWARRRQRRGSVTVVSDCCVPDDFLRGLSILGDAGYRPAVVQVFSPEDESPPFLGDALLADCESDAAWDVTLTERHVERYRSLFADFLATIRQYCNRHNLASLQVRTDRRTSLAPGTPGERAG